MKKLLLPLILLVPLFLAACTSAPAEDDELEELQDRIEELEEQLEEEPTAEEDESAEEEEEENSEDDDVVVEEEDEEPTPPKPLYNGPSTISLSSPANESVHHTEPIYFKGSVSPNTVRVGVKATNVSSNQVDDYVLERYQAGQTSFSYGASVAWSNLAEGTNTYIFTAYYEDGTSKSTSVNIYYVAGGAEMGKPVIYLYPEEDTKVFVNVKPTDGISISDPEIANGWNVVATPKGQLLNLADQQVYPYLFWEGFAANFETPKDGFVVAKAEVESFFDEKLSYLGLNHQEIADFKEFWLPYLDEKPYYFITFVPQAQFEKYAPLTVEPKPDTLIRVFFDYKGLDEKIVVPAQKLPKGERKGFVVTEWGGRLYR